MNTRDDSCPTCEKPKSAFCNKSVMDGFSLNLCSNSVYFFHFQDEENGNGKGKLYSYTFSVIRQRLKACTVGRWWWCNGARPPVFPPVTSALQPLCAPYRTLCRTASKVSSQTSHRPLICWLALTHIFIKKIIHTTTQKWNILSYYVRATFYF